MNFYDFNDAVEMNHDVMPKGTLAKVIMKIKSGGYNDGLMGWTGGYATQSTISGAVYLNCEFTVLKVINDDGKHWAGKKIWSLIGLFSHKNDNRWGAMGRSFIRSMLNSSRGFSDRDESEAAQNARKIANFGELDGLEFVVKIDVQKDQFGLEKNVIKQPVCKGHKDYDALMGADYARF